MFSFISGDYNGRIARQLPRERMGGDILPDLGPITGANLTWGKPGKSMKPEQLAACLSGNC